MDQLIAGQRKCDNPTNPLGLCTEPYFPELDFDPNEPGPSGSSPTGPSLPPKPPPVNQGKNKDKTCSRGYGYSPADCCEDRLYDWTAVYEKLMNVLIGTTVILNEGLLGWCADVGGST